VFAESGATIDYLVGTMIELPRAALMAGEIAEEGEFFSFGTNDLTQTTLGCRATMRALPDDLCRQGHLRARSVRLLDIEGVGQLVEIAAERGRATRPTSSSASAANMAAIRPRSPSARSRARLCLRLALPRADRAAGGGAGRHIAALAGAVRRLRRLEHAGRGSRAHGVRGKA
jgi:hypothetical protein